MRARKRRVQRWKKRHRINPRCLCSSAVLCSESPHPSSISFSLNNVTLFPYTTHSFSSSESRVSCRSSLISGSLCGGSLAGAASRTNIFSGRPPSSVFPFPGNAVLSRSSDGRPGPRQRRGIPPPSRPLGPAGTPRSPSHPDGSPPPPRHKHRWPKPNIQGPAPR